MSENENSDRIDLGGSVSMETAARVHADIERYAQERVREASRHVPTSEQIKWMRNTRGMKWSEIRSAIVAAILEPRADR